MEESLRKIHSPVIQRNTVAPMESVSHRARSLLSQSGSHRLVIQQADLLKAEEWPWKPGCGPRPSAFRTQFFSTGPGFPKHRFKMHYTILGPKTGMEGVWPHCSGFLIFNSSFAITTHHRCTQGFIFHQRWGEWIWIKLKEFSIHPFHHVTLILKICSRVCPLPTGTVIQGPPLTVPVLLTHPSLSPPPSNHIISPLTELHLFISSMALDILLNIIKFIFPIINAFLINLCFNWRIIAL